MKVDDPVNAVAVHAGGGMPSLTRNVKCKKQSYESIISGIWGLVAGPIFRSGGLLDSHGLDMLLWNLIGMACILAWNAVTSILLFGTLHKVGIFRVKKEVEIMGLDVGKHDERAYPECKN